MVYGPLSSRRPLPKQDWETILLISDRFQRDAAAQAQWAEVAKECVEFVEGKQWSESDLKALDADGRPALTFNKIGPLVRLVLGYHRNNRTDENYLPSDDEASTAEVADALTKTAKQISKATQQPYVDAEVFMDGIMTARGFTDWRIDFEQNILGTAKCQALDPFSVYLDCDADKYDINEHARVTTSRWASLDDTEALYGIPVRKIIEPLISGYGPSGMPAGILDYINEITPWRNFGGGNPDQEYGYGSFGDYVGFAHGLVDDTRKAVRVVEQQHYKRVMANVIIDLETGMMKPLPDTWDQQRIQSWVQWADSKFAAMGKVSPIRLARQRIRRVRWTTLIGDVIVYDDWSPYSTFTIIPYFPYFRRGKTRGMVEDLLDPQRQINKMRSAQTDITMRSANSGWILHKESIADDEMGNWERNSAKSGFIGYWEGKESGFAPKPVQPGTVPQNYERLEMKNTDDLREISGVNRDMQGVDESVKSGKAIIARQRQGVISIQTYMDNMSRSKELGARKKLELMQEHYPEDRLVRIQGEDGSLDEMRINHRVAGEIKNNITVGRYAIAIDETPLSASFVSAQFDELMELIEKGVLPLEAVMDVAIDLSSIPQKEMVKQRVQALMASQGIATGDDVMTAGATMGAPMMGTGAGGMQATPTAGYGPGAGAPMAPGAAQAPQPVPEGGGVETRSGQYG